MISFIKTFLYGAIIGIANIIPGVSGGTIMVVLDVFDDIVGAIGSLRKNFFKSAKFLLTILAGAGVAILLCSSLINYLLTNHYMIVNFFFIGVIVGSFPLIIKKATEDGFKPYHLIACTVTLSAMLFTVYFVPSAEETVVRTLTAWAFVKLLAISAFSAFCMIIPGISGSFVMLMFGTYETVTAAISELNIIVLIPIGIGVLLGVLLGSKIIDSLIKRYPQMTYFAILGFMLGSIPAIIEKINGESAFVGGTPAVVAGAVAIVGIALSYLFTNEKFKSALTRGREEKDTASLFKKK